MVWKAPVGSEGEMAQMTQKCSAAPGALPCTAEGAARDWSPRHHQNSSFQTPSSHSLSELRSPEGLNSGGKSPFPLCTTLVLSVPHGCSDTPSRAHPFPPPGSREQEHKMSCQPQNTTANTPDGAGSIPLAGTGDVFAVQGKKPSSSSRGKPQAARLS